MWFVFFLLLILLLLISCDFWRHNHPSEYIVSSPDQNCIVHWKYSHTREDWRGKHEKKHVLKEDKRTDFLTSTTHELTNPRTNKLIRSVVVVHLSLVASINLRPPCLIQVYHKTVLVIQGMMMFQLTCFLCHLPSRYPYFVFHLLMQYHYIWMQAYFFLL